MRTAVFLCLVAAASAGFLDRFIGGKSEDDKHPVVDICNSDAALFSVGGSDLVVTPYPVRTGHPMTVSLTGHVKQQIDAIDLSVNVHYGIVPLLTKSVNPCDEIACPIPAGPFTLTKKVDLPSSAPSGHYTISLKGHDANGREVVCASIKVHIK